MRSTVPTRAGDRLDLVIFDCDGVLVDSELISCGTVADLLSPVDPGCDLDRALRRYLGRPARAVTDDYERFSGGPLPDGFVRDWRTRLFGEFSRTLAPIVGVREAVAAMAVAHCVASSSDEERIEFMLRRTGLWDLFENRAFSTTRVANGKPAPDLFLLAAREMGAAPARSLVVEDSVSGVTAAKAAGMTAFGFTGGSHFAVLDQTDALRAAGADRIVGSMAELPDAARGVPVSLRA